MNKSGIRPLGRAVLIEDYDPGVQSTMIAIPESVRKSMSTVNQRATVVEVGPVCWPDEPSRAAVGDKVLVTKFAGYLAVGPADGRPYRLVNDKDIFAAIEEPAHG